MENALVYGSRIGWREIRSSVGRSIDMGEDWIDWLDERADWDRIGRLVKFRVLC